VVIESGREVDDDVSSMGEVRVTVRLTNATDEALARRGMLAPDQVRTCEADALVDTGSVRSVLPSHLADRLGLTIRGQRLVTYADGRDETVSLTGALVVELHGRDTTDEALVVGDDVLIGQTVLDKLDLSVDRKGQRVIQNPRHPNGPVSRV
jgi:clan AA aspartic protease